MCAELGTSRVGAWDNYPDWQAGEPVARVSHDVVTGTDAGASQNPCVAQTITVKGYDPQTVCVTQMDGWRYGIFGHTTWWYGLPQSETFFVMSIASDSAFYIVDGMSGLQTPLDNEATNTLVYASPGNGEVSVYRDFLHRIERTADGYRLVKPADIVQYADGDPVWQYGAAVSSGGAWLALETEWGIARVDLRTLEVRIVSTFTTASVGHYSGSAELGISDDGLTIFAAGRPYEARSFAAISITDSCGTAEQGVMRPSNECRVTDLTGPFDDGQLPDGWPVDYRVGTHGTSVSFYVQGKDGIFTRATFYPFGSAPATLRYLALGDSFSSGEGDAGSDGGGMPYYLPHTDVAASPGVPAEMCHQSRRSYPFNLAAMAGLDTIFSGPLAHGVESVACNNAHITDITAHRDGDYQGQDDRLSGLNTAQLDEYRTVAQNEFIPGRIPQSDFVEAYQPSAITLGIGGNDVQFARVITACASSIITCDYAGDPTDRRNLGESIKALYPKLTQLYSQLIRSDPGAKVFALGYPRFVNETNQTCPANVNLDYAERQMLDQGVRYIDQVIKTAAMSAGVGYLDIQDALVGHRLCDGPAEYVNPIDFTDLTAQEQFHPTANGHEAIAVAIDRQLGGADLAMHDYCGSSHSPCPNVTAPPDLPPFFGDESVRPTDIAVPSELVRIAGPIPYLVTKGLEFTIQTSLLAAGSTVRIELHSTPFRLGTAVVNADGNVAISLTLPDSVVSGYHTLHLYGTSPSGEPVDVYQIVYVAEQGTGPPAHTPAMLTQSEGSSNTDGHMSGNPARLTHSQNVVLSTIKILPETAARYRLLTASAILLLAGLVSLRTARFLRRFHL